MAPFVTERSQTTTPEYFLGTVRCDHKTVIRTLHESGFGVSYVSYPKTIADDDVAYASKSSWVYRRHILAPYQTHIIIFETDDEAPVLYIFYHHEYNWIRHPIRHLRKEYVSPENSGEHVLRLLESAGLDVNTCSCVTDDRAKSYCLRKDE